MYYNYIAFIRQQHLHNKLKLPRSLNFSNLEQWHYLDSTHNQRIIIQQVWSPTKWNGHAYPESKCMMSQWVALYIIGKTQSSGFSRITLHTDYVTFGIHSPKLNSQHDSTFGVYQEQSRPLFGDSQSKGVAMCLQ